MNLRWAKEWLIYLLLWVLLLLNAYQLYTKYILYLSFDQMRPDLKYFSPALLIFLAQNVCKDYVFLRIVSTISFVIVICSRLTSFLVMGGYWYVDSTLFLLMCCWASLNILFNFGKIQNHGKTCKWGYKIRWGKTFSHAKTTGIYYLKNCILTMCFQYLCKDFLFFL